ncbi:unnamed protein product [Gongylonema pulchrum]|uniref:Secreted protein n=1 Tax=Gongylonema pulchrum TaxID=637853 RepID=A0A183DSR2_9BILA|nr:unnamed protein product [Gongylonema pulchrum]
MWLLLKSGICLKVTSVPNCFPLRGGVSCGVVQAAIWCPLQSSYYCKVGMLQSGSCCKVFLVAKWFLSESGVCCEAVRVAEQFLF